MVVALFLIIGCAFIAKPMIWSSYRDAMEQKASSPIPEEAANWYGRKITTKTLTSSRRTEDDPAWTAWIDQYFASLR